MTLPHSKAAMESGNQLTFSDAISMEDAQADYDGLLAGLGCSSLDCLLALNTSQLLEAPVYLHASPVVDGVNLVNFPRRLLRAGKIKRVPTIVGSARDEVAGLMAATLMEYANLTADGFKRWLATNYGPEHVPRMMYAGTRFIKFRPHAHPVLVDSRALTVRACCLRVRHPRAAPVPRCDPDHFRFMLTCALSTT